MTLLARDEADIVDSWLDFHLNAGADFVIATDNRSCDGTTEILERYAREGHVHLIREPGEDLRQDEWVTRMARLAATDFGADWVVNSDADEFWWPRGESLRDVLAAVPDRYGVVSAFLRVFVPRPGDGPFAERMTVRFSPLAPINDPASLYKPIRKVDPPGASGDPADAREPRPRRKPVRPAPRLVSGGGVPLPAADGGADRAQGLAAGQCVRAAIDRAPTAYHRNMFAALHDGRIGDYYARSSSTTGARSRRGGGKARRRHEAAGRAAGGRGRRDARRSRSRRSSRTPSTPWRPRFSARRTSCDSNAVSTSSRSACTRSRPDRPTRVYRKVSRTTRRVFGRERPVAG